MTKAIEVKVTSDMIEAHNELVRSYMELRDEFLILQEQYNALVLSMIVPTETIQ